MTSRRDFIKQGCSACAMVAGFGFLLSQESCSTPSMAMKVASSNGEFSVPLSSFGDKKTLLLREASMKNDILLVKGETGQVHAFLMRCTHQGGSLHEKADQLACPRHGSKFNLDGAVVHGPAKNPLRQFDTRLDGENLMVKTT